jgi:hypothetical protein
MELEKQRGRGVRLWVGSLDGRVVSGVLVLYRGAHCVVWHAATHSEYLSSNASSLVYLTAIRAACEEGLRWFDFNPSGHLRGVEFFKESWGAKRLQFDMYHSPSFTRSELLEPAETDELPTDEGVVLLEQVAPAAVAEVGRELGGAHDVGEQDRREDAIERGCGRDPVRNSSISSSAASSSPSQGMWLSPGSSTTFARGIRSPT